MKTSLVFLLSFLLSFTSVFAQKEPLSKKELKKLYKNPIELNYGDTSLYELKRKRQVEYYSIKENAADGFYKIYSKNRLSNSNSSLSESFLLINAEHHGTLVKYFDGDTSEIVEYHYGKKNGVAKMINSFDSVHVYSNWVNDSLQTYKVYKHDSILVNDQQYYNNGNFYWISYFESGKVKQITNGINDTTSTTIFDENGHILSIDIRSNTDFRKRHCIVDFNGVKVSSIHQDTPTHGLTLRQFHQNGNIKSETFWMGNKHTLKRYDEDGKLLE